MGQAGSSPASTMVHNKPLAGCVVKVVDTTDYDAAEIVRGKAHELGAQLRSSYTSSLTHVVIVVRHEGPDAEEAALSACRAARKVRASVLNAQTSRFTLQAVARKQKHMAYLCQHVTN